MTSSSLRRTLPSMVGAITHVVSRIAHWNWFITYYSPAHLPVRSGSIYCWPFRSVMTILPSPRSRTHGDLPMYQTLLYSSGTLSLLLLPRSSGMNRICISSKENPNQWTPSSSKPKPRLGLGIAPSSNKELHSH